ncbi:MAG: HAMP domain-containing sensor histidine kinase [Eubacteriales bacterium]|nr:HAMP domain-containing sensor histidine kinase [Eubacteriales bacterium]
MKSRLFRRLFAAFTAAMLLTVAVSSFFMVAMVRAERQHALESEIMVQARDIAFLLSEQDIPGISFFQREPVLSQSVASKILSVREEYSCTVWLVYANGTAYTIGEDIVSSEQLTSEAMLDQLYCVLSGEEILVRGVLDGDPTVVTIGVPWAAGLGHRVEGAVMLHISVSNMNVDYSDMIRNAAISACFAFVLGAVLSLLIASSQTKPLRRINKTVSEFAKGRFESRIHMNGKGEIAELADTFDRMAEDLSRLEESRRSFVASVSHELRSPLTCIRGYIEGMLDGAIPQEEQTKYLGVVLSETDRLTSLVNDLLDLSRIESGNVPLELKPFDLNELMRLTLIKFETRIDKKDLNVEANLRDEPMYVLADSARIAQVLTNLIDNAIKFLPEGGLLSVSAYPTGEKCMVSVKDNGPGIPQEDLPFIFDRFYKADKAHTSGMGTGLGLSIVQKILEQHGQSIRCTSGLNGTEFLFTLDPAQPEEKRPAREEGPTKGEENTL